MKRVIYFAGFIFLFTFIFSSCQKEENNEKNLFDESKVLDLVKIKSNTLHFDSFQEFVDFIDLAGENPEAINNLLKSNGFTSLKDYQKQALDDIENYNDITQWLSVYNNLFEKYSLDDGTEEIDPIVEDEIIASLINKNQILYIGNTIYGFSKNYYVIGPQSKKQLIINTINLLNHNNYYFPKVDIDSIKIQNYTKIQSYSKDNKPISHTAIAIKDERYCNKDRKVKITNEIIAIMGEIDPDYYYYIGVKTTVRGYRKSACIWVPYKTQLTYKDVKGQITYLGATKTKYFYIGNNVTTSDSYTLSKLIPLVKGITISNDQAAAFLKDTYFLKDYGKATSRGLPNQWAIINYNY